VWNSEQGQGRPAVTLQPGEAFTTVAVEVHNPKNASSSAGIGMLALAQPAEAKIFYTCIHRVIGTHEIYALDLNHDEKPDFFIANVGAHCVSTHLCGSWLGVENVFGRCGRVRQGSVFLAALALQGAVLVNSKNLLYQRAGMVDVISSRTSCVFGYWCNVTNRYLGLKFKIDAISLRLGTA